MAIRHEIQGRLRPHEVREPEAAGRRRPPERPGRSRGPAARPARRRPGETYRSPRTAPRPSSGRAGGWMARRTTHGRAACRPTVSRASANAGMDHERAEERGDPATRRLPVADEGLGRARCRAGRADGRAGRRASRSREPASRWPRRRRRRGRSGAGTRRRGSRIASATRGDRQRRDHRAPPRVMVS